MGFISAKNKNDQKPGPPYIEHVPEVTQEEPNYEAVLVAVGQLQKQAVE